VYNNNNSDRRIFAIITNEFDYNVKAEDIIQTYQERGASEQVVRDLKDFGWGTLAYHDIKSNASYLGVCVLSFILFKFITKEYATALTDIAPNFINEHMTLKTFRNKFLTCNGQWKNGSLELFCEKRKHIYQRLQA
jgi:hypothetical protein